MAASMDEDAGDIPNTDRGAFYAILMVDQKVTHGFYFSVSKF